MSRECLQWRPPIVVSGRRFSLVRWSQRLALADALAIRSPPNRLDFFRKHCSSGEHHAVGNVSMKAKCASLMICWCLAYLHNRCYLQRSLFFVYGNDNIDDCWSCFSSYIRYCSSYNHLFYQWCCSCFCLWLWFGELFSVHLFFKYMFLIFKPKECYIFVRKIIMNLK